MRLPIYYIKRSFAMPASRIIDGIVLLHAVDCS
jgi:hypothetical protein